MRFRRMIASIIDLIILRFVFSLVLSIIPLNSKIKTNYAKLDEIEKSVASYDDLSEEDLDKMDEILYETEHEFVKYYLISSVVLIGYFILIPKYKKDQTFGQKIMKIRLVSDSKITTNIYVLRALLNSGLSLVLINPLLLYILNRVWYSNIASILLITQVLYWLISFVIFLATKETIHDKITKTKIIEVKRWENLQNKNK